jgi:hypothetical protein
MDNRAYSRRESPSPGPSSSSILIRLLAWESKSASMSKKSVGIGSNSDFDADLSTGSFARVPWYANTANTASNTQNNASSIDLYSSGAGLVNLNHSQRSRGSKIFIAERNSAKLSQQSLKSSSTRAWTPITEKQIAYLEEAEPVVPEKVATMSQSSHIEPELYHEGRVSKQD